MNDWVPRIEIRGAGGAKAALISAWDDGAWARGPHADSLAQELGARLGRKNAVLTPNGFSALLIALLACDPRPKAVVTAAATTCFAMVNAILAAGAQPIFADLDAGTAGLSSDIVGDCILSPNHFGIISSVSKRRAEKGVVIIEDGAQSAMSALLQPTQSTALVLSFYPTKWLNGIDGGAVLTPDATYLQRMQRIASYEAQTEFESSGRINCSMPDLHAAVAMSSLRSAFDIGTDLRRQYISLRAAMLEKGIPCLEIRKGEVPARYVAVFADELEREQARNHFIRSGVGAGRELGWVCPRADTHRFPVAARLIASTLSLPIFPSMTADEHQKILSAIKSL